MNMSVTRSQPLAHPAKKPVPLLQNGDRMTRAEFERRYAAMPWVNKAELIEGVVYIPSPVRYRSHAKAHALMVLWLGSYATKTKLEIGDNGTVRLDEDNEPQPDIVLFMPAGLGSAEVDADNYISGSPELVCEIAGSSVNIDLHDKLNAYRRNGVREYIVWRTEDEAIDWFCLCEGRYEAMAADGGILKSPLFPGLWLDPAALLRGDMEQVLRILAEGMGTAQWKEFAQRISPPK